MFILRHDAIFVNILKHAKQEYICLYMSRYAVKHKNLHRNNIKRSQESRYLYREERKDGVRGTFALVNVILLKKI